MAMEVVIGKSQKYKIFIIIIIIIIIIFCL